MPSESDGIRIICLGTGTSHGVPMIGCDCAVCTSDDPHDRRTRPSIAVEYGERVFLVDTAPELRLQCVANGIERIDAVLFTHHHADHVAGLDDLRRFNALLQREIVCYASPHSADVIRHMFRYAFEDDPAYPSQKPELRLVAIEEGPLVVSGKTIVPIPLMHGPLPILGYRFGDIAYCTDCNDIPAGSMALLDGLDTLILDGLRRRPHPTHFNLEQAVETARRVGARRTYFTHIAHALGHAATNAELPEGMALAYDGQIICAE